jgi:hypothetical protein
MAGIRASRNKTTPRFSLGVFFWHLFQSMINHQWLALLTCTYFIYPSPAIEKEAALGRLLSAD